MLLIKVVVIDRDSVALSNIRVILLWLFSSKDVGVGLSD